MFSLNNSVIIVHSRKCLNINRTFRMSFSHPLLYSGGALAAVGGALQQVGQARDALDANVKRVFIDPMQDLHNTEMREIKVSQLFSGQKKTQIATKAEVVDC